MPKIYDNGSKLVTKKTMEATIYHYKAIETLYKKWQVPKNEVINRLLLITTRYPETIGVIEQSITK